MSTVAKKSLPALEELKPGKQWVGYDQNKKPLEIGKGTGAEADNPDTWATYEQAVKYLRTHRQLLKGLGREFIKEQGISGVDLDHCVDEQGNVSEWALYVIRKLNSYTEYSPSGKGLHIWVRGSLPENINADIKADRDDRIEAYDCKRYFTITGRHFPDTPTTLEQRQSEITALYEEVQEKRAKAKNPIPHNQPRYQHTTSGDTPYGLGALENECRELATTPQGGRNTQLNLSAFKMGQLVGGNALGRSTAENALYDASLRTGLDEKEIEDTLRGALEAGTREPRFVPVKEPIYIPTEQEKTSHTNANGHKPEIPLPSVDETSLPTIFIGDQLRNTAHESLQALTLAEKQNPMLFIQSAQIKRIGRDEKHTPIIMDMGEPELRHVLTNAANYYRLKEKNGEFIQVAVSPPKDAVQDILAMKPDEWPFPPLEALVQTPIIRPNGTVLDTPGYDQATGIYYMPQEGLNLDLIPPHPTHEEVKAAAAFITGFIQDFPFEGRADHANTVGLLLSTVTRQMFKHVPLALIDATKQGTGKGLLTDMIALIATGKSSAAITQTSSDEEWDKRITALLMEGASLITVDNIEGVLRSPILAKVLTSDYHKSRVLGFSKNVTVPQRAVWIANGNNIQLGGDIPRRSYRIRLISQISDPWTREDFKYPDLDQAVLENRGKIISALLIIARGWFEAGQPQPTKKLAKLATFSRWVEVIGGILSYAGIDGFLENITELHKEADVDGNAWAIFLETWQNILGDKEYKTSELIEKLNAHKDLAEVLPEPLGSMFLKEDKSLSRKLGRALSKKNGTPYGLQNLRIVQGIESHSKVATFKVAGYAGYAVSNLSLRMCEKSEELDTNKKEGSIEIFHIEGGGKLTPQIPHTPQTDDPGLCSVCKAEVEYYTPTGVPYCSKHYRPEVSA